MRSVDELPDQLNKIFYTLEFLRNEGLIDVKEVSSNTKSSMFELPSGTNEEKISEISFYYEKLKRICGWNIEMKPGLIHFKQQGYQTDNQLKQKNNNKGSLEGVEIYARNIINNGVITSDSRTKVVTDNYKSVGEISSFSKKDSKEKWHQKWWGQIIILVIVGLVLSFFTYKFGWNK